MAAVMRSLASCQFHTQVLNCVAIAASKNIVSSRQFCAWAWRAVPALTLVSAISTLVCVTVGVYLVSLCQHILILGIRGDSASPLGYTFPGRTLGHISGAVPPPLHLNASEQYKLFCHITALLWMFLGLGMELEQLVCTSGTQHVYTTGCLFYALVCIYSFQAAW